MPLHRPGHEIRRSAAFRMTLRFTLIFIGVLLVLGLAVGLFARESLERSARMEATELLDDLAASYARFDPPEFAETLDQLTEDLEETGLAFGYRPATGLPGAGAIALPDPQEGWGEYLVDGNDEDEALWVRTMRLPDGSWLSAGASKERYYDALELMQDGVIWAFAIAVPLAIFSGGLLSRMILSRIDELSQTAEAVRNGDLSRRAPLRGIGDEFDRLAGNLNRMLDRSETLACNLRNVSVGIAHELRTPLARLQNRLEELRLAECDTGQRIALIDKSLEDIGQTLATFDALLKIGEMEADTQRADFEPLDLSQLASDLAEIYEPVVSEGGRSLSARIEPGVEINGNRALLTQMIANLLENAMEHTPPGTDIAMTLSGGEAPALELSDDGPGIPEAVGERVFDRFVHGAHRSRGAGLGLALVRSICALHGFDISLKHNNPGASFSIRV